MVKKTANSGYHYLFKVTNDQYKNIKNFITLKIENKIYSIDVKANENSFLICKPSKFYDENKKIKKYYKWIDKNADIQIIPDEIHNLIKTKTDVTIPETIINNNVNLNSTCGLLELDIIKPYFYYLSSSRINDLNKWFKLASLIKSIYNDNDGLNLILSLSRKSTYYKTDDWIIERANKIIKKQFTINTFYYWLKKDNPEKYQELFNHVFKTRKTEDTLVETIKINSEYLTNLNDNLTEDTILNNNINNIFNSNIKSLNIKSSYDTGKTQLIKKKFKNMKIKKYYGCLIG